MADYLSILRQYWGYGSFRGIQQEIIAQVGATSIKDMGKVMGAANKALAGLSDGRTISTIVKKELSK